MAYQEQNVSADYSFDPMTSRVLVTTGNTDRTITLPDASVPRRSRVLTVKKVDSGTGVVKIVTSRSQTVAGASLYQLNQQHQAVILTTDGSNWVVIGERMDTRVGANGESVQIQSVSELITIAAAASTDSVGNLLPANSLILGVVARVTTVVPANATTLSFGDATTAARFGSGVLVAAGTQLASLGQFNTANTNAQGPVQANAAKLRITPDAAPLAATGKVRVTVFYISLNAPTQ